MVANIWMQEEAGNQDNMKSLYSSQKLAYFADDCNSLSHSHSQTRQELKASHLGKASKGRQKACNSWLVAYGMKLANKGRLAPPQTQYSYSRVTQRPYLCTETNWVSLWDWGSEEERWPILDSCSESILPVIWAFLIPVNPGTLLPWTSRSW